MKKKFMILCMAFTSIIGMAQTVQKQSTESINKENNTINTLLTKIDSLFATNRELTKVIVKESYIKDRYKLYQTENIYTLLELDTATGKIKQVQWSLESENEGSVTINDADLSFGYGEAGTYELYPTKNMYQFILIDKILGFKWHVQWGMESNKRWIRRMY